MKNKKEFIELIERYETITLEEIKDAWNIAGYKNGHIVAQSLTGFGGKAYCTLCSAVINCSECVYGEVYGCLEKENTATYMQIDCANTPLKLRNAFRKRAEHLRNHYKEILQ